MSGNDNAVSYHLFIRADRPIEGCELSPLPYLQQKGGGSDRARHLDSSAYYYKCSWRRGPKKPACANSSCPRGMSFEPVQWSKAVIGGPELVCNVCTSAGHPSYECCFCSRQCFVMSWKDHARKHCMIRKLSSVSESSTSDSTPPNEAETEDGEGGYESTPATPATANDPFNDWHFICDGKTYVPTAEDVGSRLRIDVWALSTTDHTVLAGPVMLHTEPVLSAPTKAPKRALQTISGSGAGISGAVRFRVVSYNILAEMYATRQAYPYVDMWNLAWPYRRKLLYDELEEIQGDVVCLQEVQADHFDSDINPFMQQLGYDGIYKPKSREFMGPYGKVDGCATFWKKNKFIMTENYSIEFNDMARQEASHLGLDEAEARRYVNRLNRDNIAQIVVLEALSRPTGRSLGRSSLCVVNTHLYSNQQRADVKLWQTMNLLREIQNFVVARDLALMLCGDFNSEPDSAVYDFITHGHLPSETYPELQVESKVRVLPDAQHIVHELDLASAMATALGGEPAFTNYTRKFKGTLDYIFYTPSRLRVMAVTAIPEESDIQATSGGGLPATCYPSDHILQCCDVALINSGAGNILTGDVGVGGGSGAGASAGQGVGGGNAAGGGGLHAQTGSGKVKSGRLAGK